MVDEPALRSQARVFSVWRGPDPQSALAAKLIDSPSGVKANYDFFVSNLFLTCPASQAFSPPARMNVCS